MPITWDEDKQGWAAGPAIPTIPAAAAAPTKAEFDALAAAFNTLVQTCRDAGLVATD